MPVAGQTWLLHISDIHFRKRKGLEYDPYDLDTDLRDQLEADVTRLRKKVGNLDGIVVSGDIAFAGRKEEYDIAFAWLQKLVQISGCPPGQVWCVPGNHDTDRSVFETSLNLRNLHNTLRPTDPDNVDAVLGEAIRDSEAANTLFRPFEQYCRFANTFSCPTRPSSLFWEDRLPLNDGSTLVLRGANSALISDPSDNNKDRKLILGTLQAAAQQRADEAVVFICHHPLDWLIDYDKVIPVLNARARVQLFGHKHIHFVDETNNCLRIVAGAVQPERREPKWRPRYNCMGFSVTRQGDQRKLSLDLYPRIWSEKEPKFVPDYDHCGGAEHKVYTLALDQWDGPALPNVQVDKVAPGGSPPADARIGGEAVNPAKTLTYRYLSLPHIVRLEIAQDMRLLKEEDEGLFDATVFERILRRAQEANRLGELWDRVEACHEEKLSIANPFAK